MTLEIISRKSARERGLTRYFTGMPCRAGHVAVRNVAEGKCDECRKLSWEKVRRRKGKKPFKPALAKRLAAEAGERFYSDGSTCPNGHTGMRWTYNGACVSCAKAASKKRCKSVGYAYARNWIKNHPERARASIRATKAKRRGASGRYTEQDIARRLEQQRSKCAWCRTSISKKFHIDHIIPIALGGTNDPKNLQLLCVSCNCRKCAKHPLDFARQEGRLL